MQAIMESAFDAFYLVLVITLGIRMMKQSKGNKQFWLFGLTAVILGCGDAFHLVPRACALLTNGLENHVAALGIGKLVTSITMTIFYVMLFQIWSIRYQVKEKKLLTALVHGLATIRIALCFFPQNLWTSADAPLSWGIYRNIPFLLLGLVIICLYERSAKEKNDQNFRWLWLAIVLSFLFYIPVVLFAQSIPLMGMLMIPKTCAYIWAVWIGYNAMKKEI